MKDPKKRQKNKYYIAHGEDKKENMKNLKNKALSRLEDSTEVDLTERELVKALKRKFGTSEYEVWLSKFPPIKQKIFDCYSISLLCARGGYRISIEKEILRFLNNCIQGIEELKSSIIKIEKDYSIPYPQNFKTKNPGFSLEFVNPHFSNPLLSLFSEYLGYKKPKSTLSYQNIFIEGLTEFFEDLIKCVEKQPGQNKNVIKRYGRRKDLKIAREVFLKSLSHLLHTNNVSKEDYSKFRDEKVLALLLIGLGFYNPNSKITKTEESLDASVKECAKLIKRINKSFLSDIKNNADKKEVSCQQDDI